MELHCLGTRSVDDVTSAWVVVPRLSLTADAYGIAVISIEGERMDDPARGQSVIAFFGLATPNQVSLHKSLAVAIRRGLFMCVSLPKKSCEIV